VNRSISLTTKPNISSTLWWSVQKWAKVANVKPEWDERIGSMTG